jgi:general stress protein CsbA
MLWHALYSLFFTYLVVLAPFSRDTFMKNRFLNVATSLVLASASSTAQAQTNCTIDWTVNVATAGSFAYGLNVYNGYTPP